MADGDLPDVPTWEYENRSQRRARVAAQFQQLTAEIAPYVRQGDFQTAQSIVAARVPEAAPKPKPAPVQQSGSFFGKIGGALGNVGSALGDIGSGIKDLGEGAIHGSPGDVLSGIKDTGVGLLGAGLGSLSVPAAAGQPLFAALSGETRAGQQVGPNGVYRDKPDFRDMGASLFGLVRNPLGELNRGATAFDERLANPAVQQDTLGRAALMAGSNPLSYVGGPAGAVANFGFTAGTEALNQYDVPGWNALPGGVRSGLELGVPLLLGKGTEGVLGKYGIKNSWSESPKAVMGPGGFFDTGPGRKLVPGLGIEDVSSRGPIIAAIVRLKVGDQEMVRVTDSLGREQVFRADAMPEGLKVGDPVGGGSAPTSDVPSAAGAMPGEPQPTVPSAMGTEVPGAPTTPAATVDILNLPNITPKPLGKGDRIHNAINRMFGQVEEDTIATPAMRYRNDLKPVISSQASLAATKAKSIIDGAFTRDEKGRITTLEGAPTIQDVAARLPEYRAYLTPEQLQAMTELAHIVGPYRELLGRVGADANLGSRTDIMDGGFYIPRGRADIEGADAPIKVGSGRGGVGGKKGFEKTATYDSMMQGLNDNHVYSPIEEAINSYARDAGNKAVEQKVGDYFKNVTDENGNPIASTAHARLMEQNPGLADKVDRIRRRIESLTGKLDTAEGRAKMAGAQGRELASPLARLQAAAGDRVAQRAALKDAQSEMNAARTAARNAQIGLGRARETDSVSAAKLDALEKRFAALNDRMNSLYPDAAPPESFIRSDAMGRIYTDAKGLAKQAEDLQNEYDALLHKAMRLPFDQAETASNQAFLHRGIKELLAGEAAGTLTDAEKAALGAARSVTPEGINGGIDAMQRRADALKARGGKWSGLADSIDQELAKAKAEYQQILPDWTAAKDRANATPRDQGTIGFSSLNGYTFPDAVANVANKYLNAEKPLTGLRAPLDRTANAFNNLMRGLRASTDVSFLGIQGLLGATRDPIGYGRAMAVAFKSMADPNALGAYIREFDKRAAANGTWDSRTWAQHGLHIGGVDTEFSIGQGLGRASEGIQKGTLPGTSGIKIAGQGGGGLNPVRGSNRAFGYFGDTLRLDLAETIAKNAAAHGFDINDPAVLSGIAQSANLATGWSPHTFAGSVGQVAEFAPRFLQSQLELIGNAVSKGGIEGSEARRMLTSMLGSAVGLTILANEAGGRPIDYTELLDPSNSNFMRFRTGGQDVSLLGPWDSLLKSMMALSPVDSGGAKMPDPLYIIRSKASPSLSAAWDVLSGKDFRGNDTHTLGYAGRSVLPFSVQNIGQESPLATAIGATGVKASPLTATEQLNQVSQTTIDPETGSPNRKAFYDSSPATQKAVKDAHPDLWQRAVDTGNQKRQRAEEIKAASLAQQTTADQALLDGTLNSRDWQAQRKDRQLQKVSALAEVYHGAGAHTFQKDPVLRGYFDAIDQSKQANNGVIDWNIVDAYRAQLTPEQSAHIDENVGLDKTPIEKLRASLASTYYDLPEYRGYTADEARQINQIMSAVDSRAPKGASEARKSALLRALPGYDQLDPKVKQGATRQIWGVLPVTPDRQRFLREHPEAVALLQRQGPLTAADIAAVNQAIGAA